MTQTTCYEKTAKLILHMCICIVICVKVVTSIVLLPVEFENSVRKFSKIGNKQHRPTYSWNFGMYDTPPER